MGPLQYVSQYMIQMLKKIQTEYICSLSPKQSATDSFNAHCQEWIRHTVWADDCRSWSVKSPLSRNARTPYLTLSRYKNNETGRVNAVWPGSSLHYIRAIGTPRYEDYDIEYLPGYNQWSYLGMGFTRELVEKGDASPYLRIENIDPAWLREIGYKGPLVGAENEGAGSKRDLNEMGNGVVEEGPRKKKWKTTYMVD